jgi:hypothetical protein
LSEHPQGHFSSRNRTFLWSCAARNAFRNALETAVLYSGVVTEDTRKAGRATGGKRRHRAAPWIAWSLWGLIVVLSVTAIDASQLKLYWFYASHPFRYGAEDFGGNVLFPIVMVLAIPAYATVGALVASLRPKNGVRWLCIAISGALLMLARAPEYRAYGDLSFFDLLHNLAYQLGEVAWSLTVPPLLITLMLLVFPDGRLPSRRWWAVVGIALGGYALIHVPGLFASDGNDGVVLAGYIGIWTSLAALLASVACVVLRWRSGEGRQHQQIKLLAYTVAVAVVASLAALASWYIRDDVWGAASYPTVVAQVAAVGAVAVGIPMAIGVAVLKHRLYDVDLLINRTLVYGALTVTLAGVYFGGVAGSQAIFGAMTGQDDLPQLATVLSTLLIAALFMPLRYRIQSTIDRRFYRRRYDARKTLEAFSTKLRDETDLEALNADLVGVVAETMQPAHVSMWLSPDPAAYKKSGSTAGATRGG